VSLLLAAATILAFRLWSRTARLARFPALGLPLALGAVFVFQTRFEPRPETISYALLGVTALATIASPLGIGTWKAVFILWPFLSAMRREITEFGPPAGMLLQLWTVKVFWATWALTIVAAVALFVTGRRSLFAFLPAAAGLYLSARSYRSIPLLLLLSAPLWGAAMEALTERFASARAQQPRGGEARPARARRSKAQAPAEAAPARGAAGLRPAAEGASARGGGRLHRTVAVVSVATILAAVAFSAWAATGGFYRSILSETWFGFGLQPHAYAIRFASYLDETGFAGKVLNSAADGGYLEYRAPAVRPYMDPRYTHAPTVSEYFAALADPAKFEALHREHGFDGALLKVNDSHALVVSMLAGRQWRLAYADLHRAFFVPASDTSAVAWPPRFYEGEDLGERVNGRAAIEWTTILIEAGGRQLLLDALDQFGRAREIPSFVIQYALEQGMKFGDRELVVRARALFPKLVALEPSHRRAVETLMEASERRLGEAGAALAR